MTTKSLSLLTLLFLTLPLMAQEDFTLEDLNFGGTNYRRYVPTNKLLTWWGEELIYVSADTCYVVDKGTCAETPLLTRAALNDALGAAEISTLEGITFPYPSQPLAYLATDKRQLLYDFAAARVVWTSACAGATHRDWHAASRNTAMVRDHQLVVVDSTGDERQLTSDGSSDIVYGQSVHRDEFGITKGTFWSPSGSKLAFYRMDQSMVAAYPQVDLALAEGGIAGAAPDRYPMAGATSHVVTIGVYDMTTQQITYLQTADPVDRYFTNLAWSPDERTIYLFELPRAQNDCRLMAYDSTSGACLREVYRETDDKYVEPLHPIVFLPWDDEKFILQSQKDGYNHLYLYDVNGHELAQLTSGAWVVMALMGFDAQRKTIIYASNEASSLQRNVWTVSVASGKRTLIGSGDGWHNALLSAAGTFLADNYSAPTTPRKIDIVNTRNGKTVNYLTAADPWEGHHQPLFSAGTLLAADDSTLLNYRLVLPHDFDPARRYPAVVYVYGGPHAHCVDASWHYGSRAWETYMSQRGYILFILDNRGSDNRGKAFEQVTFHHLGQEEMSDQLRGVAFLKSLPYVDGDRLGVHGWSYGGFMTISLMTHYPDIFKVGVAGGPVIDWRYYEVMYGERYMGTPQTNADGYAQTSLLPRAKDLRGHLQIIIGSNDKTVVPQQTLAFLAACVAADVQPDFFVYPSEPHNMRGHASVHLHERITNYFDEYLK